MPRRNKSIKTSGRKLPINFCDRKQKYPTEKQAKATAEYQMLINQNLELFVYRCDLCQKWHLTRHQNR